jgi:uncharacterized phage protein (TIGR02218 family)
VRDINTDFLAHFDGSTTLAAGLRITRTDNDTDGSGVFAWTNNDQDRVVDGDTFLASPGADFSAITGATDLSVANTEAGVLIDDAAITTVDVLGGRWDNAAVEVLIFNWADPTQFYVTNAGTVGNFRKEVGRFVSEFRSLAQALQQAVGSYTSKTCRYRLGVNTGRSHCPVDLASHTYEFTVATVVTAKRKITFTGPAAALAAEWFEEGICRFDSDVGGGENAGLQHKVRDHTTGPATVEFSLPFIGTINVGDTGVLIAGCKKRRDEDCHTKFGVVEDFGGEPDIPGVNRLIAPPPS